MRNCDRLKINIINYFRPLGLGIFSELQETPCPEQHLLRPNLPNFPSSHPGSQPGQLKDQDEGLAPPAGEPGHRHQLE